MCEGGGGLVVFAVFSCKKMYLPPPLISLQSPITRSHSLCLSLPPSPSSLPCWIFCSRTTAAALHQSRAFIHTSTPPQTSAPPQCSSVPSQKTFPDTFGPLSIANFSDFPPLQIQTHFTSPCSISGTIFFLLPLFILSIIFVYSLPPSASPGLILSANNAM